MCPAAPPALAEAPAAARAAPWYRRALPFVVAAALIGLCLARVDRVAFLAALGRVDHLRFGLAALATVIALLLADCFATLVVYRQVTPALGYAELLAARGASYLPALLNHHVGQAYMVYRLAKTHRVPLARMAGATLVVYATWIGTVLGLGTLAMARMGKPLVFTLAPALLGLFYLLIIALEPRWLRRATLLSPLFEAGVKGHLRGLGARLPHALVLCVGTWAPFALFGVNIPFNHALADIPIIMVAATLPIAPQGFGTREVLSGVFFARFAPGGTEAERLATVVAAATSWGVALMLVEIAVGLWFMRRGQGKAGG